MIVFGGSDGSDQQTAGPKRYTSRYRGRLEASGAHLRLPSLEVIGSK